MKQFVVALCLLALAYAEEEKMAEIGLTKGGSGNVAQESATPTQAFQLGTQGLRTFGGTPPIGLQTGMGAGYGQQQNYGMPQQFPSTPQYGQMSGQFQQPYGIPGMGGQQSFGQFGQPPYGMPGMRGQQSRFGQFQSPFGIPGMGGQQSFGQFQPPYGMPGSMGGQQSFGQPQFGQPAYGQYNPFQQQGLGQYPQQAFGQSYPQQPSGLYPGSQQGFGQIYGQQPLGQQSMYPMAQLGMNPYRVNFRNSGAQPFGQKK